MDHHRSGNLREAAECYQQVLRNNPGNADALYLLGCLAHQFGSSLPASQFFYQAIAIAPNQPQYHNALGLALMELEKQEGAEEHFQRAIALRNQPELHNNLGTLRKRQGRFAEAIDAYQQALKQDPGFVDGRYNLSLTLFCLRYTKLRPAD